MALGDPYVMWGTAPRSGARQPAASGVQTSAGAPRTNTVQSGGAPQQWYAAPTVNGAQVQVAYDRPQMPGQAPLPAVAPPQLDPKVLLMLQALQQSSGQPAMLGPRFPTPTPGFTSARVGPQETRFGTPALASADPRRTAQPGVSRAAFGTWNQPLGFGGGGALGGEGGAMGAGGPGVPGVAQRQVAQVGTAPSGPQSAPTPTTPTTQAYRFTPDDIAWAARQIDPQMAAIMGFGPAGIAAGTWGKNTDFFENVRRYYQANRDDPNWPNVPFPEDFSLDDFAYYFLGGDLGSLYETPGNPNLHRIDAAQFMQDIYDYLQLSQQGQGTTTPPGAPPVGTNPPGTYGEDQRRDFRRPLSPQEQNLFRMVEAATTGRVDPTATQQAEVQAMIDADLAAGRIPNVAAYVKQVGQAETANPGTALYSASMGQLPPEMEQQIREQSLRSMGNIGARFGTEAAGASAAAAQRVSQERMLEAQAQIQNLQGQAAVIDAQREQQAHQALYQEWLRNLPPSERDSMQLLLSLLGLNVGNATTGTSSVGGGSDAAISQLLSAIPGLASAGLSAWNEYKGRGGGDVPGETTPTVLGPEYGF